MIASERFHISETNKGKESFWCTYAEMWVKVKYVYDLTITSDEKAALTDMLDTC